MTSEFKLFRKPRRPKLEKLDLNKIETIISEDDQFNTSESESNSTLSTDREIIPSSYINSFKLPVIQKSNKLLIISEENNLPIPKNSFKTMSTSNLSSITDSTMDSDFSDYKAPKYKPNMRTILSGVYQSRDASQKTTTNTLVKPYKAYGPDPLPQRPVKFHSMDIVAKKAFYDNLTYENDYPDINESKKDNFQLNDFFIKESYNSKLVDFCYDKVSVSTFNYVKLSNLLAEKIQQEKSSNSGQLKIQTLIPDIEPVETNRKPFRQAMIEMASYLKKELSEKTGTNFKVRLNPVSKWQKINGTQTEIVLYEDKDQKNKSSNNSNEQVSPAELAVIDSLLRNGLALSLKAHFIDILPDISSLKNTLIYINLSFNNFKEIPSELLDITQLEAIKLRSNPIKYLPDKFAILQNLKVLCLSYCLIKEIPACIYELRCLIDLDLSYNRLTHLNENLLRLVSLKSLNVEGNELEFLPCFMLKMQNLEILNVKNNYLHPLIWRNLMVNTIPRLFDLTATKFCKYFGENSPQFQKLSYEIQEKLDNFHKCDTCYGRRYGNGLRLVKPCEKIFGVKYLPFLFLSCSPECFNKFRKAKRNSF
ncbi:unnamed protein product [Brachionus calyciflorus]|uniref:Uncharacterized protein n=1 Tax=Brachionus calyciflorus TaxID=104777 RepID=A0A813NKF5_9BILA|nr:unnamed protein product [Brachionus calyciflorus]